MIEQAKTETSNMARMENTTISKARLQELATNLKSQEYISIEHK